MRNRKFVAVLSLRFHNTAAITKEFPTVARIDTLIMNTAVAIVSVVAEDDEEGGTREELLLLISNEPGEDSQ